jgi:acetylornithine/N-succinyldiaminopimelate aminotransferase
MTEPVNPGAATAAWLDRYQDSLLNVFGRPQLVLEHGDGAWVWDVDGRRYLDLVGGLAVNALGHNHPALVAAVSKQAGQLVHVSNFYTSVPQVELAERLLSVAQAPPGSAVFFCNSGTEAVEAAMKFARRIGGTQGRTELVAFEGSFHGRTMGALSMTWKEKYRAPFEPLVPGVRFCAWNDLKAAATLIGPRTAAVFIEPVQGEGGVRVAPNDFLQGLADICREAGALLVSEEVQCGLGRTGKLFAYQHAAIRPDMLTLAKPLGGGLPLGAVILREEITRPIAVGDHGSTFGGNPVAAAAAQVVLDRLTSPGFLAKVERKGLYMLRALHAMQRRYPEQIFEVRGCGLMAGIEFTGSALPILKALRANGILATRAGDNVLRLLPPLVVKRNDIRSLLTVLEAALSKGMAMPPPEGGGGAVA